MSKRITQLDDLTKAVTDLPSAKRQLVALVGPPGSGKSTLSKALNDHLNSVQPDSCAIVPMDGFHLDDAVLRARGRLDRKGAPDTFDVGGLLHLHQRLALNNEEDDIAVPLFDRSQELSRAGARIIPQSVRTVLVEGNYLLLNQTPWDGLAAFYDLTVFIDVPEAELERRLIERWAFHGLSAREGRARVLSNDMPNARLVATQSRSADLVFEEMVHQPTETARPV